MKSCSNCSTESIESANFCLNCGQRLEPAASGGKDDESVDHLICVTAVAKGFREKFDGYNDAITVELKFENLGGKDIKAFKGAVDFYDLFEERILGLSFQIQEPLYAGATKTDTLFWEYNQFKDDHQRLRFTEWDYLISKCSILAVILADGTKITSSEYRG